MPQPVYNTLEDIQLDKDKLQTAIQKDGDKISELWHELTVPKKNNTKGEMVGNLVMNSITAIDAFLLVRKLMKTYGHIFTWKKKKK